MITDVAGIQALLHPSNPGPYRDMGEGEKGVRKIKVFLCRCDNRLLNRKRSQDRRCHELAR